MKNVLIILGLVILAALGFCGYAVWQIAPEVKASIERLEAAQVRMTELDQQHPFDPTALAEFDATRFGQTLDTRVELGRELAAWRQGLENLDERAKDEDMGIFDMIKTALVQATPPLGLLPDGLEKIPMGPSEFRFQSGLFWSVLKTIDEGAGGEEFKPLRRCYSEFKGSYRALNNENRELAPLEEVIGSFDEATLAAAREVMAQDPDKVLLAINDPTIEIIFLGLQDFADSGFQAEDGSAIRIER